MIDDWFSFYSWLFVPVTVSASIVGTIAVWRRDGRIIGYGSAAMLGAMAVFWSVNTVFVRGEPVGLLPAALIGAVAALPTVGVSAAVAAVLLRLRATPAVSGLVLLSLGLLIIPLDLIALIYAACAIGPDCL